MSDNDQKPILVTGSHRSGSTWVGQMIARSPAVAYIHEPFNIEPHPGHFGGQFDTWFTYVCDSNADQYEPYLRECLALTYPLATKLRASKSPAHVGRSLVSWSRFNASKGMGRRPLMKDPLAVFSAEWLARTFDMRVIMLIRHPAAFAGSIKEANWSHPFQHFLDQPLLMRDHLSAFRGDLERYAAAEQDIVDQAILLWNMIHATILTYRDRHPRWYFVRHEDISIAPQEAFGHIYRYLNLDYSPAIQEQIMQFSQSSQDDGADPSVSIRRDSLYNLNRWRDRLTDDEIDRVREATHEISRHFYDETHWQETENSHIG